MMFGGKEATVGVVDADGSPAVDRAENRRRWFAIAGAGVGVLGSVRS